MRVAGIGFCVVAFAGTALAGGNGNENGNGNGNGNAGTPPGQEKKAEPAPPAAAAPAPQAAAPTEQKSDHAAAASKPDRSKSEHKSEHAKSKPKAEAKIVAKAETKTVAKSEAKGKSGQAHKSASPKSSGSYKQTSHGTDLKKGMSHKHTICHATGSASNPYVVITPSVSGVFHGHMGHQGDEDIIPPFVYKGTTYSQNWDAAGQALFAAGCAAHTAAPAVPPTKHEESKTVEHGSCPAVTTTTERVIVGVWHATGAYKNGQRKFVFITPSLNSAHYDKSKHSDDIPVYADRSVTVSSSADKCSAATVTPPAATLVAEQPQPVVPTPAGQAPARGTVGVLPAAKKSAPVGAVAGAVSPTKVTTKQRSPGGVLDTVASAPKAVAQTAASGTLPFTGIPLWIAALIGAALLGTGLVLRRSAS
ncbi:MAG TPA: hypothetical protein VM049_11300 [Gaiellaceae bacterium]|nr:hypothetical protein [Gaiellaceae bacterium]